MNVASSAASVMSQQKAMLAPAPAATPFTAQTTGFSSVRMARMIGLYCRRTTSPRSGIGLAVGGEHGGEVLPGAEGAAGAGEQHGAHGVVCGARRSAPSSASAIGPLKLLSTSGRFSVMVITPSRELPDPLSGIGDRCP